MNGSQVAVDWTPPAHTGGATTLHYTVTALDSGVPSGQTCTAASPATGCVVAGLTPGTTYTFAVRVDNNAGSSAESAPSNLATPLADSKAFSALSPTGSGTVVVAVSGGGASCAFERVQLLSAASVGAPAGRSFPHGVLDFVLSGCDTSAVAVAVTYPGALPAGAQYWKRKGGTWGPFGGAALSASTVVLALVDGGAGDDDGVQNGRIVDPGGVTVLAAGGVAQIPTLGASALVLLAAMLGLWVWWRRPSLRSA